MSHEKRIRQLAPVRVTESEEIELMRIAARMDRPVSYVRRLAYRDLILAHGGTVDHDDEDGNDSRASLRDSSSERTL